MIMFLRLTSLLIVWCPSVYRWHAAVKCGWPWLRHCPRDKWSCRRESSKCCRCWGRSWSRRIVVWKCPWAPLPQHRSNLCCPWARWRSTEGHRSPRHTEYLCVHQRSNHDQMKMVWFLVELKEKINNKIIIIIMFYSMCFLIEFNVCL